ncbi:hypothetical protein CEXT_613291 [Caerostris extrusa]|uniref:Uncharacterized protein n=1 Tax=Caerostris extrusa TaxID=172846 RepID=A0AAV4UQV7_CAEEX|nr:hypothetical protein CEXT_613291 [Caerostris extrusa]
MVYRFQTKTEWITRKVETICGVNAKMFTKDQMSLHQVRAGFSASTLMMIPTLHYSRIVRFSYSIRRRISHHYRSKEKRQTSLVTFAPDRWLIFNFGKSIFR